jgi:hypothetical protein
MGRNFGTLPFSTVSGTVTGYYLTNGHYDAATTPLSGWTVNLLQDGQVLASTTTADGTSSDPPGTYSFAVRPGTYTIAEVVPPGWRELPALASAVELGVSSVTAGGQPNSVAAGDFDNDGHVDFAMTQPGSPDVWVFYGAGDGTFSDPVDYPINDDFKDDTFLLAVFDFEHDGRMDIAAVGSTGVPQVLHNFGDRQFFQSYLISGLSAYGRPRSVAIGDFNGDHRDDLAIAYDSGSAGAAGYMILLTGSKIPSSHDLGWSGGLVVGDVNNDGHLDVVVNQDTPASGDPLAVGYGTGTGAFFDEIGGTRYGPGGAVVLNNRFTLGDNFLTGTPLTLQTNPAAPIHALALVNLNGDFQPDLVALVGDPDVGNYAINVFLNRGSGGGFFTQVDVSLPLTPGSAPVAMAPADINGDGLLDLILADPGAGVAGYTMITNITPMNPSVTVGAVQDVTGIDLTNVELGQLAGVVFEDSNRNGSREPGEPGRAGATVYLDLNRNDRLDPAEPATTTNAHGAYAFAGLPDGTYHVRVLAEPGRVQTFPGPLFHQAVLAKGEAASLTDFGTTASLLQPIANQNTEAGKEITFTAALTTAAAGRTLSFRLDPGAPVGATIDPRSGVFTWTPTTAQAPGRYAITVHVHDPLEPAFADAWTFTVDVLAAPAPATPAERLVADLYRDLLGRVVEPAGLTFHSGLLDQGLAGRQQVANMILHSPEYATAAVRRLYERLLLREADPAGQAFWIDFMGQGHTAAEVEGMLLASDEYFSRRSGGTAEGFLQALYQDVFGRFLDSDGAGFWGQALAAGTSRTEVARAILTSAEGAAATVRGWYDQFLGRLPDDGGMTFWTNALQKGEDREAVLAAILASDEYFMR